MSRLLEATNDTSVQCRDVFERRTEVDLLHSWVMVLPRFRGQIVSVRVKTLGNTNLVASRYVRREKAPVLVDLRRSAGTVFSL